MKNTLSVKDLFEHQLHFGSNRSKRNPIFKNRIYKTVNKIDIINLDKTLADINRCCSIISRYSKSEVLLLSSIYEKNEVDVKNKWPSGLLTNRVYSSDKDKPIPKLLIIDKVNSNSVNALKEANKMGVELICLVDTDIDIKAIKNYILTNDDYLPGRKFILDKLISKLRE